MNSNTDYVWDPLVRTFHWTLVTAYALAWATGDDWMNLHEIAGYTVGGLLLFRLFWGLVGTRHWRLAARSSVAPRPASPRPWATPAPSSSRRRTRCWPTSPCCWSSPTSAAC